MTAKYSKTQTKNASLPNWQPNRQHANPLKHKLKPTIKVSQRLKAAKELQRNEEKKARPEHVVNLINDALWLFGLVITIYLAISLASFSMDDPAWSRSVPKRMMLPTSAASLVPIFPMSDIICSAYRFGGG